MAQRRNRLRVRGNDRDHRQRRAAHAFVLDRLPAASGLTFMPLMPVNPNTTRARLMLEIASELAGAPLHGFAQAEVTLTPFGPSQVAPTRLRSHSTIDSIEAVLARQADVAIINPATALAMAV